MKIFYKNNGTGSLLAKGPDGKRVTIKPGINTVPDEVGAYLIGLYPKVISGDEEAQAAKAKGISASNENAALKAKVTELESQVAKLQLIAAQVPSEHEAKDKEIAALKAQLAEFEEMTAPTK